MSLLKDLQAALNIAPEMAGGQNSDECVEPHAIIQNMLDKGMDVWACMWQNRLLCASRRPI